MSRALDKLEQSGLLKRSTNPQCRRSWLISLTEEGNSLADKVIENNLNNAIDEHNPDNVN